MTERTERLERLGLRGLQNAVLGQNSVAYVAYVLYVLPPEGCKIGVWGCVRFVCFVRFVRCKLKT